MPMNFNKILIGLALLAAAAPLRAQSKKDLLRQNELLVRKVEALQEELDNLKKEESKKDNIRDEMIEIFRENED